MLHDAGRNTSCAALHLERLPLPVYRYRLAVAAAECIGESVAYFDESCGTEHRNAST
jgi:hypothetical protein